jgi:hypothetical protein
VLPSCTLFTVNPLPLSLIVEGTTEKVLKFIMLLLSFYIKNICLNEQNVFLNIAARSKLPYLPGLKIMTVKINIIANVLQQ